MLLNFYGFRSKVQFPGKCNFRPNAGYAWAVATTQLSPLHFWKEQTKPPQIPFSRPSHINNSHLNESDRFPLQGVCPFILKWQLPPHQGTRNGDTHMQTSLLTFKVSCLFRDDPLVYNHKEIHPWRGNTEYIKIGSTSYIKHRYP